MCAHFNLKKAKKKWPFNIHLNYYQKDFWALMRETRVKALPQRNIALVLFIL